MPDKNSQHNLYKAYQEAGECCRYCLEEIPFESITRDHLRPQAAGGTLEHGNLIFACRFCNNLKGSRTLEEFKDHVLNKMRALIDNIQYKPYVEFINYRTYRLNRLMKLARILKSVQEIINERAQLVFMPIQHTKEFGIYHWDTFDNETILMQETDTVEEAEKWIENHYDQRLRTTGADRVEIVNSKGEIVEKYNVG